jgi:hypothetical protein
VIRLAALAVVLLLVGCAGETGSIELGVGKTWNGGGFALNDQFDDKHDATSFDFTYDQDDSETAWIAWTIPLGPQRVEIVDSRNLGTWGTSAPVAEEPTGPILPAEETFPWEVVTAALGAMGLYGAQRGKRYLAERNN